MPHMLPVNAITELTQRLTCFIAFESGFFKLVKRAYLRGLLLLVLFGIISTSSVMIGRLRLFFIISINGLIIRLVRVVRLLFLIESSYGYNWCVSSKLTRNLLFLHNFVGLDLVNLGLLAVFKNFLGVCGECFKLPEGHLDVK